MNKGSLGAAVVGLLTAGLALGFAAGQAAPSIQVVPTPAGRGQLVTVYGRDFCGSPGCSPVTIALDDTVLTAEVQVSAEGTFSFPFVASQVPDQYRVTARQTTTGGSVLEASYGLLILAADLPPGQTPAPFETQPPPTTTAGPSASPTATITPAPTGGASATPSATSPTQDDGSSALWWALAAGLGAAFVVLASLAAWRLRLRRSR